MVEEEEQPQAIDRFFGNRRLRQVGVVLSLGVVVLVPLLAMRMARMQVPADYVAPPRLERPRDPQRRALYDRELILLEAEARELKQRGLSQRQIAEVLDPKLRDLNRRLGEDPMPLGPKR